MRRRTWVAGIALAWAVASTAWGACAAGRPDAPRTLILTVDGVSYRVIQHAREQGAFAGWPATKPLISTFPSMTNIAFTALLKPLGTEPIAGYELRHYEYERNKLAGGGPFGYHWFPWRDYYQVMDLNKGQKARGHLYPRKRALKNLRDIEKLVLDEPRELMLGHLETTDFLAHFRGDDPLLKLMLQVSEEVDEWQTRHQEIYGRPLRVVILSDHGNTLGKVDAKRGIRKRLKRAGFRIKKRLRRDNDVVAPTFGVVGYGVLFLDPAAAERASRAVLEHPAVELAAWVSGEDEITVISADGSATIDWQGRPGLRRIRYRAVEGDPLRLEPAVERIERAGRQNARGFASENAWTDQSALDDFPDAPRRLIDALTGTYVRNPATVIFSLRPGYAWGLKTAQFGAFLLGGKLEGTHGGLDRVSSTAFFLRSDEGSTDGPAVRADRALEEWSHLAECVRPGGEHP